MEPTNLQIALIVVDVQNDFCEGGSLAVSGGAAVAQSISTIVGQYPVVVATKDWHIDPGGHFSNHPDFVDSWPPHCRADTPGAQFHPNLDTTAISRTFYKGAYSAAYSGFEGFDDDGTSLAQWLRAAGVTSVDVVGIATDHCVKATALDARAEGFTTRVLAQFTAGVGEQSTTAALAALDAAGVRVN